MPKEKLSKKVQSKSNFFGGFKFSESYISLVLGIIVVLFSALLVFSFTRSSKNKASQETSSEKTEKSSEETGSVRKRTYTVQLGENLWGISEKIYKSGYNWVDIAKANKMENPDLVYVGAKLAIPNVEPKIVKTEPSKDIAAAATNKINGTSFTTYTVSKGDYLWKIAVNTYGDGFRWVEIARANNISNPDYIYSGTILKLPR